MTLQIELPLYELLIDTKAEIEAFAAEAGLKIIHQLLEEEIDKRCGEHGQQSAYRHGAQAGYVVFGGRKVTINKPRLRAKGGGELTLERYKAFQHDGRMERAVARQLKHQVSTRSYSKAIDAVVDGYGIDRSSVSRHWKMATEAELRKLSQRPLPKDLVALLIDGQYFHRQCIIVAVGVDKQGCKHVLGLWDGATENSAVARGLLNDLRERGLDTEQAILVVMDGGKGLHKAVREVFGEFALIQRCRVHKLRNVIEHLPEEKRGQAVWRLRGAWSKANVEACLKELRSCIKWLETISPSAARSLEEGLEETVTVTRLGLTERLAKSFSSTNLIESCFSNTGAWTRRVKRWRDAKMVLRWAAAALLAAEQGFKRVRGREQITDLLLALNTHKMKLAAQQKAA